MQETCTYLCTEEHEAMQQHVYELVEAIMERWQRKLKEEENEASWKTCEPDSSLSF